MSEKPREFPHIYLPEKGNSENYTRPQGGGSPQPPCRDRAAHAKILLQAMGKAMNAARQQLNSRESEIARGKPGFYLEFQLKAKEKAALKSLENRQKKIELVAVKKIPGQEDMVTATVFVPESAAGYFEKKIEQYRDEDTDKKKPKNEALISRLESVEIGTVKSLFTDKELSLFPEDDKEVWWEVWLRKNRLEGFQQVAEKLEIPIKPYFLSFPEREIVLVMSDVETMARLIKNSDAVAELRIAKDTPSIFLEMGALEQAQWAKDLADRLLEPEEDAVSICILDSGATRIHPLLSLALGKNDLHAFEPSWGVNDNPNWRGHGTAMAGLCLYSDSLVDKLQTTAEKVKLEHRLESVKILPTSGENAPKLYGAITEQGISLPEIEAPQRRRVFCMAVTSSIGPNNGTPSSWSAAVDELCFNDGKFRRLMIISAGNIRQDIFLNDYLNINDVEPIENPGQAWNALIVGAYTEKINILDRDYRHWQPLAPGGDLSPNSRTSVTWEPQWPVRPDVVFEGGNMACDGQNPAESINDLCLLTTYYRPELRSFDYMKDTSSAAALASYMAARIMSERPDDRPETVRALIVHSAEWTPAMKRHFSGASKKTDRCSLLRRYGYGVPDLERALQGASNDLTLIIEDELQPFFLEENAIKTKEMKLHKLPWPREKLEELGEVSVELKVTLSYFIEPNPGERGWAYRHRYASHGLRFKVKDSLETDLDFRWRINKAAREEEENREIPSCDDDNNWFLGPTARDGGSIHCDIWHGTAVELAQKDAIAIYPVGGWWKEKKYLERYNSLAYYSLIVSIRVPGVEVDIYTPVSNSRGTPIP